MGTTTTGTTVNPQPRDADELAKVLRFIEEHEGHHGLHVRVAASQHDLGGGPQQVGSWCWVGRGWGP